MWYIKLILICLNFFSVIVTTNLSCIQEIIIMKMIFQLISFSPAPLLISTNFHNRMFCFSFPEKVWSSMEWPQINWRQPWNSNSLAFTSWDYRHVPPCPVHERLGTKSGASYMLTRHSISWATKFFTVQRLHNMQETLKRHMSWIHHIANWPPLPAMQEIVTMQGQPGDQPPSTVSQQGFVTSTLRTLTSVHMDGRRAHEVLG